MLYTVERQLWNRDGILRVCFRKIRSAKTLVEEKQTFLAENFSVSEVSKVKPANRGQTNRGWMRRWMCSMLNYSRAYFIGSFFLQTTEICLTNIYYKFSYKIKKSIIILIIGAKDLIIFQTKDSEDCFEEQSHKPNYSVTFIFFLQYNFAI